MHNYKYRLIAHNESGAKVEFEDDTVEGVKDRFDIEYSRKGFCIIIESYGKKEIIVKKTYR